MRLIIGLFICFPIFSWAQLKEFEVSEMPRPDVAVVQANTQFPDDVLLLVYSSLKELNFRSSLGSIDKAIFNTNANRYEILFKPNKQMLFVYADNFVEQKIETFNPNPKDVFYYKIEENKNIPDARVEEVMDRLSKPQDPSLEKKKLLKSVNIKDYKYIVIRESNYEAARKVAVKWLKKAGYNTLDIYQTSKGNSGMPSDLKENPELALYIDIQADVIVFTTVKVRVDLLDYEYRLINSASNTSPKAGVVALKNALPALISKNQKTEYVQSSPLPTNESTSISRLLDLKKLLDVGVISEEEYNSVAQKLKEDVLEKTE